MSVFRFVCGLCALFLIFPVPTWAEEVSPTVSSTAEVVVIEPVVEVATSTPMLDPPTEVTSTEIFVASTTELFVATTTEVLVATSTEIVPVVTSTEVLASSSSEPMIVIDSVDEPLVPPCDFLMVELLADPSAGPEWVRLEASTNTAPIACLLGFSLSNGSKTTFAFTTTSIASLAYTTATVTSVQVFFPMPARSLTNSGATVIFKNASGTTMDQTTFPALKKDERWVRTSMEESRWEKSSVLEAQMAAAAAASASTATTVPMESTETPEITETSTGSDSISDEILPGNEPAYASEELAFGMEADVPIEEDLLVKDLAIETAESPVATTTTKKTATSTKATVAKKATPKKVAVKKTAVAKKPKTVKIIPEIPTYTFDMFASVSESMRVRLIGTVGSPAGLLAAQTFVLQNPDGRGLLVKMNREQPMPEFGQTIELTGLLRFTNDQLTLTMQAADRWKPVTPITEPEPRPVDLLAPGQEDAWSLMAVTATVREVKSTSLLVETDEVAILVKIRPVTGYRAARLKPGDVIQVKGLLDSRQQDPVLYPRSADDVTVLQAAQAVAATTKVPEAPPWMPLGAAGVVVAFGQGLQEWRRRRETQRLERRLARSAVGFEVGSAPALARRDLS